MIQRMSAVSLGQGQGPKAATLVAEGANIGCWVVLQVHVLAFILDCH